MTECREVAKNIFVKLHADDRAACSRSTAYSEVVVRNHMPSGESHTIIDNVTHELYAFCVAEPTIPVAIP
jgi:hypothetical protein